MIPRRVTESLWCFGVMLYLCSLPRCASAPDMLRTAIDLNDAAAAGIVAAEALHNAKLLATYHRLEAHCPPLPDEQRQVCRRDAEQAALLELAPEREWLDGLVMAQHTAADSLATAKQCRADGLSCEESALREAEGPLSRVRAGLTQVKP